MTSVLAPIQMTSMRSTARIWFTVRGTIADESELSTHAQSNNMSAELHLTPTPAIGAGVPEALYFASGDHQLFGWLHGPSAETRPRVGLVICKAFGYEAVCSHRSVAEFARNTAQLGIPTLRFDYMGTGDSADLAPEADQLEAWSSDALSAIDELRRLTGVERVYLLGFRLGALIATLAACRSASVAGLIAVAPVISGRRYLKEMRATRLAACMGAAHVSSDGDARTSSPGSMEVSGFSFSAATLASLAKLDLMTSDPPQLKDILIMDSISLPTAREWAAKLSSLGSATQYEAHGGVVEMLMTDPQFALPSQSMLETMRAWVQRLAPATASSASQASPTGERPSAAGCASLRLAVVEDGRQSELRERPVLLGSEAILVGIATEPHPRDKRRRGVILLNVGAEYHIGPSRLYVSLARRWAQHGYTVLRLDLAGLGDSGVRSGRPVNEVFPPSAIEDIRLAIDFMQKTYGIVDMTLGGLCSGAYHALRAAVVGLPVNRLLLVNPMNFLPNEGISAEKLQLSIDVARNVKFYRDRALSMAIWKRIFTGHLKPWRIMRILFRRPILALGSSLYGLARRLGIHLPRDLGWELEQVAARGVKMVFVFARDEPGIDVLKLQAGATIGRLGGRCLVHVIDSADHIFTRSATRDQLEALLSAELYNRNPRATPSPASVQLGA